MMSRCWMIKRPPMANHTSLETNLNSKRGFRRATPLTNIKKMSVGRMATMKPIRTKNQAKRLGPPKTQKKTRRMSSSSKMRNRMMTSERKKKRKRSPRSSHSRQSRRKRLDGRHPPLQPRRERRQPSIILLCPLGSEPEPKEQMRNVRRSRMSNSRMWRVMSQRRSPRLIMASNRKKRRGSKNRVMVSSLRRKRMMMMMRKPAIIIQSSHSSSSRMRKKLMMVMMMTSKRWRRSNRRRKHKHQLGRSRDPTTRQLLQLPRKSRAKKPCLKVQLPGKGT